MPTAHLLPYTFTRYIVLAFVLLQELVGFADEILQNASSHHDDLNQRQQQLTQAGASSVQSSLAQSQDSFAMVQEAYGAVVAASKGQVGSFYTQLLQSQGTEAAGQCFAFESS